MPQNSNQALANRYILVGQRALEHGNYETALANWLAAIEYLPENAELHNDIGLVYLKSGNLDKAIQNFYTAISLNSNFFEAHYNLGNAYLRSGKIMNAIREYEKAAQKSGYRDGRNSTTSYPASRRIRAKELYEQAILSDDLATKIDLYNKAIKVDSTFSRPFNNLAVIYFRNGQPDSAAIYFWRAIQKDAANAEALNNLGYIFSNENDHYTAIKFYKRAIKSNPGYYVAYNNLAVSFYRVGRVQIAKEIWQQVLQVDPGNKVAQSWLNSIGNG